MGTDLQAVADRHTETNDIVFSGRLDSLNWTANHPLRSER